MSEARSTGREPSLRHSLGLDRHPLTRVKLLALGLAVAMMTLGGILTFTSDGSPAQEVTRTSAPAQPDGALADGPSLGSGFAPSRPPAPGTGPVPEPVGQPSTPDGSTGLRDLSPFMVKGGFGLFIGFAIGFAMRAFLRLAIVVTGFYLLVLTLMAYVGWIEIHWELMENQFTRALTNLGSQFESFKTFLTGVIPAGGLTAAGFAIGLRRK